MSVEPVLASNEDKDYVKTCVKPSKPSFAELVSALAEDRGKGQKENVLLIQGNSKAESLYSYLL